VGKNLPDLIKLSKGMGKYGVIVFEDFNSYLRMDTWNRELLDKYLVKYRIGILAFVQPTEDGILFDTTKKVRLPVQVAAENR
jgi:heparan sulfate N-deacetylase/N-sulfotransferase NDST2